MNKKLNLKESLLTHAKKEETESKYIKSKTEIRNRGITLIALVITIIILIILAGVTISLTLGDNGIINKAKYARELYLNTSEEENVEIAKLANQLDEYVESSRENFFKIEDYTGNLIYKLDLEKFNAENGVTLNGNAECAKVSSDKKYLTFDGSGYVTINNRTVDPNSRNVGKTEVSVSLWYRNINNSRQMNLFVYGTNDSGLCLSSYLNNNLIYSNTTGDSINRSIDPDDMRDGNWHNVIYVRDSITTMTIYYDGVPFKATGTFSSNTMTDTYLILGGHNGSNFNFIGDMTDARVYNEALNVDKAKQIYDYGRRMLK